MEKTLEAKVIVIDDDDDVRDSIQLLIESVGLNVETFSSAKDFLTDFNPKQTGCLIVDVRMPIISGLELQRKLNQQSIHPPIIIMSGHGDVPMAVRAMKEGAFEFLEKPFNPQSLLETVNQAILKDEEQRFSLKLKQQIRECYQSLTEKEKQVFKLICNGVLNKQIASQLNISQSTVEARRSKVMEKMQAENLSGLIRFYLELDLDELQK